MYCIDAIDATIQSDPQSNNNSTENEYSDSGEASDGDEVRSLSARSGRRRRGSSPEKPESLREADICAPVAIEVYEDEIIVEETPKGGPWDFGNSHAKMSKKSKKSKVSEKRSIFES
jgi:hypothetical protein